MHGYLIPFRLWNESSEGTEEKKKANDDCDQTGWYFSNQRRLV